MTHVERKREDARRLAHQAGARVYPFGVAWRVVGPTVDMLLSDLALLDSRRFRPDVRGAASRGPTGRKLATPVMPKLQRWLEDAAEIEAELLSSEHLDAELVDAVGVALVERRAHVRLVVDFVAPDSPRLRVRVVDRRGGWWLLDTWGQVAPPVKNIARAQRRFDALSALRMGEAAS